MQVGFLGLPGAGKSTLFSAIEGRQRAAGGRGPGTAVVRVPDPRVQHLSELFAPRKTTFAEIVFLDPATVHGSQETRGALPESMLAALRDVDVLVFVIAAWDNGSAPGALVETLSRLEDELLLRDLERVENRLQRLLKEGKKAESQAERALLEQLRAALEAERPLREGAWSEEQLKRMRSFQFLSQKPVLVVQNVDENGPGTPPLGLEERPRRLFLSLSARVEQEVAEIGPEEQQQYLTQFGLERPARDVFVQSAYRLLDLVSFFTVGEDEVRAWPVRRGSTAPVAAGKIHSDLQKGFIRAEVIHYDDFVRVGSLAAARAQGLLRLEGKQYIVQDGDIVNVRHA